MTNKEFNRFKKEISANGSGLYEVVLKDWNGNIEHRLTYDILTNDLTENPAGLSEKQIDQIHEEVFSFREQYEL